MNTLTLLLAATTALAAPAAKRASALQFFGVNEAGPEFGESNFPGIPDKDYVWPDLSTIDTFIASGMNTFRINTLMERMIPDTLTGSFDAAYMGNLSEQVDYITGKGAYAMITPHNYGRYYGEVITDVEGFGAFWAKVAEEYAGNEKVVFDTNNEFHDMSSSLVAELNQAAIDAIRGAGASSQWIHVEGNAWTGAWTWTTTTGTDGKTNAETMGALTDPEDKLVYQVHLPVPIPSSPPRPPY